MNPSPHPLSRPAAWAALFLALGYVLSFALQALLFNPGPGLSPAARLDFYLERQHAWQAWMLLYPLQGLALGLLTQGLRERLGGAAPAWMSLATPVGWLWGAFLIASGCIAILGLELMARQTSPEARQALLPGWRALNAVHAALGGGNELLGGVWTLLLAAAARAVWNRWLIGLSLLIGVAGVLSIWPPLEDAIMVFGIGQILWFGWVAHWLARSSQAAPALRPAAASLS